MFDPYFIQPRCLCHLAMAPLAHPGRQVTASHISHQNGRTVIYTDHSIVPALPLKRTVIGCHRFLAYDSSAWGVGAGNKSC